MARSATTAWLALFGIGCGGIPEVVQIDALDGDAIVATLADGIANDDVFTNDLPNTVSFDITFDETMALPSARENVWIEDQDGGQLSVDIDGRLSVISVFPTGPLDPGENHTLVMKGGLEDNSGRALITGYRIAFFTAP